MKKLILSTGNSFLFLRKTVLLFAFICFGAGVFGQTTFTGNGNWSNPARWSAGVPLLATNATIASGAVCTIDINAVCNSLTLTAGGSSVSLTVSGTNTLNVTNAITMNFPTGGTNNTLLAVDAGSINCASISALNSTNNNRDNKIRISTGALNVSGNLTMGNTAARNDITFTGNGTLYVGGSLTTGTFVCGTGIVNFNGAGAQIIPAYTYYNLTTSNNGVKTLAGATTIGNDLNILNTTTLQIVANNLTVTGVTNINDAGILNDNNDGGTNIFTGLFTVNSGCSFSTANNSPFVFRGGILNEGTFNKTGTGTCTFNTNNQYISGSSSLTITNFVTTGFNVTNRNTGVLTLNGNVAGTGSFTNGDIGFNSNLFLTGNGNLLTLTGTIDFASNANTVNFNGTGNQTIKAVNYYNLSIAAGARTVTLQNSGTIGIANVFSPGVLTGYTVATSTVNFNGTVSQDIPAFTFNHLTISGGSTKTLTGNVTVGASGVLNLNSGVLELADYNLIINNSNAAAITGTYSSTNMISTNGSGFLKKKGTTAANFIMVYPVGSGGYYSPMTITAIAATLPTYITVRAVPTPINPVYIKKYWDVNSNIALTGVTATFQYDNAELNGATPFIDYSPDGGTTWQSPPVSGTSSFGANSFTITGNTPFRGYWTMGSGTYYSYQTGGWDNPNTWTFDPSGTTWSPISIPSSNDKVFILAGRTVTLNSNIASTNLDITINASATIDLATYQFSSTLASFAGQGMLRLASVNFPTATTNTFVNAGGGTTEYYNSANFTLPATQATYNHLNINTPIGIVATQLSDITLNGDLYIKQGNYRINDNLATTKLNLTINGNTTVDANGLITVGQGSTNSTTNPYWYKWCKLLHPISYCNYER